MASMWQEALRAVEERRFAVLVVVVATEGSVPGSCGAKMIVTDEASIGTVGGGLAEAQLIEVVRTDPTARCLELAHDRSVVDSLCSGRQWLVVLPLSTDAVQPLTAIVAAYDAHHSGVLQLGPERFTFSPGARTATTFVAGDDWCFQETIGLPQMLTIIGGGHVSLALSRVMATLPFRILVLDDRTDVPTMAANQYAHWMGTVDYAKIAPHVQIGHESYVVIMTHGHQSDGLVLSQLVHLPLRYLGMMGSRTKVREVFARLVEGGVSPTDLEKVRSPIGIPIGSHTPEEIAISIAAEIVKVSSTP